MLISIIITTYNSGKVLIPAIESILAQEGRYSEFDMEVIVVDDCSTDDTWSILSNYEVVKLQNEENSGGPNRGRNKGLEIMQGDYFCIADHDDIWEGDRLKYALPFLSKAPIISSGFTIFYEDKNDTSVRGRGIDQYFTKNETFKQKLCRSRFGQNTYLGSLIIKSDLKNIRFEMVHGCVDFDWVLRIFEDNHSYEIGRSLYKRIVDGGNLSLNAVYRAIDLKMSLEVFEKYHPKYPKEVKKGRLRLYSSQGKYRYVTNDMPGARHYFTKGELSIKNIIYYLTTFFGRNFIVKQFTIFG
tara:strand:+ start:261 stop:1157 length:897 start_codon:yes stop_codon:yes gene_type:complete